MDKYGTVDLQEEEVAGISRKEAHFTDDNVKKRYEPTTGINTSPTDETCRTGTGKPKETICCKGVKQLSLVVEDNRYTASILFQISY